jgi:hypothetical protein
MHHEALMVVGPIDRREVLGYLSFEREEGGILQLDELIRNKNLKKLYYFF